LRIAYTNGDGEEFVSDGYGGEYRTINRDEAESVMDGMARQWPDYLFWIVEGK
jgi:hypothetical protein